MILEPVEHDGPRIIARDTLTGRYEAWCQDCHRSITQVDRRTAQDWVDHHTC